MASVPNGWPPLPDYWRALVLPGVYGDATNIPQITVNMCGHITNISNVAVASAATNVLTNVTTNYTATSNVSYIGVRSNGSGNITVTMPLGTTFPVGKSFIIKDESGRASTPGYRPVIQMSGTDLLDGQTTTIIAVNYAALQIMWVDGNSNTWSIV